MKKFPTGWEERQVTSAMTLSEGRKGDIHSVCGQAGTLTGSPVAASVTTGLNIPFL
jgi:hypothetical protein